MLDFHAGFRLTLFGIEFCSCQSEDKLLLQIKDSDSEIRYEAIKSLVEKGYKQYASHIVPLLADENEPVRMLATFCLREFNDTRVAKDVVKLLQHPSAAARRCSALVLGSIGSEFVPELAKLLKDKEGWVKASAAMALGELKAKEYTDEIGMILKEEEAGPRMFAAWSLGYLGAKKYVDEIAKLLKIECCPNSHQNKMYVIGSLVMLGAKAYSKDIAAFLKDKNPILRAAAIKALGKLEAKEYASEIEKLLDDNAFLHMIDLTIYDPMSKTTDSASISTMAKRVLISWNIAPKEFQK